MPVAGARQVPRETIPTIIQMVHRAEDLEISHLTPRRVKVEEEAAAENLAQLEQVISQHLRVVVAPVGATTTTMTMVVMATMITGVRIGKNEKRKSPFWRILLKKKVMSQPSRWNHLRMNYYVEPV